MTRHYEFDGRWDIPRGTPCPWCGRQRPWGAKGRCRTCTENQQRHKDTDDE